VPRRLVFNGNTISPDIASPPESFVCVPMYGASTGIARPYGRYSIVLELASNLKLVGQLLTVGFLFPCSRVNLSQGWSVVMGLVKLYMLGERDRTHIGDSGRRDNMDSIFVEI
jgi:hypothetical protein